MPPSEGRSRNIIIWFISFFFFLTLLAGGGFLLLYITLPETKDTVWFPIAGMVLVGIPWVFWLMTCIYRCITTRAGEGDRQLMKPAATFGQAAGGAAVTPPASDSPVESPGGAARKVRFGNATVMGDGGAGSSGGSPGSRGATPRGEADGGDSHDTHTSSDGSSLNSHESELPLALSISS